MRVYHYSIDGYYMIATDAYPDPMSPGDFLCPAHATFLAPPDTVDGEIAKFTRTGPNPNDGTWEVIADPAIAQAEKEAEMNRQVLVFRDIPGKDPSILGAFVYKDIISADGKTFIAIGYPVDEAHGMDAAIMDAPVSNAFVTNARNIPLKKMDVVANTVVDRDPEDIFLDDIEIHGLRKVVFYRNDPPLDTKVIDIQGFSTANFTGQIQYKGNPMTDPANAKIGYIFIDGHDGDAPLTFVDSNGIPVKKVDPVAKTMVDRASIAISKDPANSGVILAQFNATRTAALNTALGQNTTPDDHAGDMMRLVLVATNVFGTNTPTEVAAAKTKLLSYRTALNAIRQARFDRDTALAALDPA